MRFQARKLLAMLFLVGLATAAYGLRGESFDDSVRLLVDEEQYVEAGLRDSGIKFEQRSFPVALRGRRSVRIVDDLEGLDPSAACERSQEIYQRTSQALRATTERILRFHEGKTALHNNESLLGDNHAVCVGLYCVARHCCPRQLVQELRSLDTFTKDSADRARRLEIEHAATLAHVLETYCQPDNACQVSLLMQSLQSPEVSEATRTEAARLVSGMLSFTGKPTDRNRHEIGRTPFTNYSWDVGERRGGCGLMDIDCQRDLIESLMRLALGEPASPSHEQAL